MTLRLQGSLHQADLVHFEQRLEKIGTALIEDHLELAVAWVVVETIVMQVCLVDLHWTPLVAHHELLERQKAQVPTITLFIGHKLGDGRRLMEHGTNLELPNASIDVTVAVEWSPIFKVLRLIGRQWVLSNVGDHVLVIH